MLNLYSRHGKPGGGFGDAFLPFLVLGKSLRMLTFMNVNGSRFDDSRFRNPWVPVPEGQEILAGGGGNHR
jgi:hypothetical protein